MTPGVWRELGIFALLVTASGALFYAFWWLRAAGRRSLASQRQIAERAHLDTYTPQSVDREWSQWARHHSGGL